MYYGRLALLLLACGGEDSAEPRRVEVEVTDDGYSPDAIQTQAGQPLRFTDDGEFPNPFAQVVGGDQPRAPIGVVVLQLQTRAQRPLGPALEDHRLAGARPRVRSG